MNINPVSIETLDVKKSVNFIDGKINDEYKIGNIVNHTSNIWTIDDFFSKNECDEIIKNSEEASFIHLSYRNSDRLLAYDTNKTLTNLIQSRLEQQNQIFEHCVTPYGFDAYNINWEPNKPKNINRYIRINKYTTNGFNYHRDAQLTMSPLVKSNYSMLIYLNDDFQQGETEFIVNNDDDNHTIVHNGMTIQEELLSRSNNDTIKIIPKKGKCVIFDQRLLHCGNEPKNGVKYILRTDLICTGAYKQNKIETPLLTKIEKLCKYLFRQAQLNELESVSKINLYDVCLNLRQCPEKLVIYPEHLEQYLKINLNDMPIYSNLIFAGRDGSKYIFKYSGDNAVNKLELVKICVIFAVYSLTKNINKEYIAEFNKTLEHINFQSVKTKHYSDALGLYHSEINFDAFSDVDFLHKLVKNIKTHSKAI